MNRKKAIKEWIKVKKVIGKNIDSIKLLIDNSVELSYIILQLKKTKENKKTIKELTEVSINIKKNIKKLITNTYKTSKSFDLLGMMLFHHPYFP